jgi:hypothetical protein
MYLNDYSNSGWLSLYVLSVKKYDFIGGQLVYPLWSPIFFKSEWNISDLTKYHKTHTVSTVLIWSMKGLELRLQWHHTNKCSTIKYHNNQRFPVSVSTNPFINLHNGQYYGQKLQWITVKVRQSMCSSFFSEKKIYNIMWKGIKF